MMLFHALSREGHSGHLTTVFLLSSLCCLLLLHPQLVLTSTSSCPYNDSTGTIDLTGGLTTTHLNETVLSVCSNYYNASRLILSNNSLMTVDNDTFTNFYDLTSLDLSFNQIELLPEDVFWSLWKLLTLDLSYNNLTRLQADLIKNKQTLQTVNFNHNNISEVEFMFVNEEHIHLQHIYMRYNSLKTFEPWPYQIYKSSDDRERSYFYLEHNKINQFSNTPNWKYDLVSPHNRIIYLMYNQISNFAPSYFEIYFKNTSKEHFMSGFFALQLHMTNNPYICDCNVFIFSQSVRESIFKWVKVQDWMFTCDRPSEVYGEDFIRKVPYEKLVCNRTEEMFCPSSCFCHRPHNNTLFIDCSGVGLKKIPDIIPDKTESQKIEMILDDNFIEEISSTYYLKDIISLSVKGNLISSISLSVLNDLSSLQSSEGVLDLRNNRLTILPPEIISLDYGRVLLSNNPLECHCEMFWMQPWITLSRADTTVNPTLSCTDSGGHNHVIINATRGSLKCNVEYLIPMFAILGALLALSVVITLFAYRCPYETKVLIFKFFSFHLGHRRDADYELRDYYDAYLSYNHEDYDIRQWVIKILTPKLKKKYKNIRLFNPLIDYEPGADSGGKHDELCKAMEISKRIIIILCSSSFTEETNQSFEVKFVERPDNRYVDNVPSYLKHQVVYILYNLKAKSELQERVDKEPWKSRLEGRRVLNPDDRMFVSKLRYEMPQKSRWWQFRRRDETSRRQQIQQTTQQQGNHSSVVTDLYELDNVVWQ